MTFRVCIDTPGGRRYSPSGPTWETGGIDDGLTSSPGDADEFSTFEEALKDIESFGDPGPVLVVRVMPDGTEVPVPIVPDASDEEIARYRRVLTWYAWTDRYVPRFEGVGHVGIGGSYWPHVENDLGRLAREALGVEYCASAFYPHVNSVQGLQRLAEDEETSRRLIGQARAKARDLVRLVTDWKHGGADPVETLGRIAEALGLSRP